jgi:pimeloyl-ACP methyl ester carboxylesterase/DNA-binding winged helix-turn-helix (wHTH) protein
LGEDKVLYCFENFSLDTERRELRGAAGLVPLQPQVFDLLAYLIRNRDRVVSKDDLIAAIWAGRIVSESTLTTRINAARTAIGDSGAEQRLLKTLSRKGVRFVGLVSEQRTPHGEATGGLASEKIRRVGATTGTWDPATRSTNIKLRQQVKYCRTADGVRLAYASVGSGPKLVRSAHWLGHLEYDWELPLFRHFLLGLAEKFTVLRYDARGNGLSDWDVGEVSLAAWVDDLETVVDAAGLERFPLFGYSQGCAVSIAFAVRHPERVSHLILYGGFATGRMKRTGLTAADGEKFSAMKTLIKLGWGADQATFRQLFTSLLMPTATKEQADAFNELQRLSASPECAVRYFEAVANFDVRHLLAQVKAPTLVMHVRDDASTPIEAGRELAAGIPQARFVAMPGRNHIFQEQDPCVPIILEEVSSFLSSE